MKEFCGETRAQALVLLVERRPNDVLKAFYFIAIATPIVVVVDV